VIGLAALCALSMLAGGAARSAEFEPANDHLLWLRLSDGAVAQSLDPVGGCCISIRDIETDGRGGWFVAGNFTSLGGVDCPELVHVLASLRVDPDWCPRVVGGTVYLLARAGQTLYFSGDFDSVGGVRRASLAAVDTKTGSLTSWHAATLLMATGFIDEYAGICRAAAPLMQFLCDAVAVRSLLSSA
jgi:hypothetical protein